MGGWWWLGLVVRRLCGYILRCSAFVKVSAVSPILDDTWQSPLQADFWLCNGFTNQSCPGRLRNGDSSRDCCHHRSLVLQNGTWFRYVDDSHACLKKNKEHFTNIWTQSMLTFSSLWNLKTLTGMADLSLTPSNQDAARKFKWRLRGSQPKSKSWAVPETVFHLNRGKDKSKSSSARPEGGRGRLIRILFSISLTTVSGLWQLAVFIKPVWPCSSTCRSWRMAYSSQIVRDSFQCNLEQGAPG